METMTQKHIKQSNLLAVFRAVSEQPLISRQEIAAQTGISTMTVGKVVELFRRENLLQEGKNPTVRPGRKTGQISLRADDKKMLILDLSQYDFKFGVLKLDLNTEGEFQTVFCPPGGGYSETLSAAMKKARAHITHVKGELLGVGVVVPGVYDAGADRVINNRIPELEKVGLKALVAEHFPAATILVDEDVNHSARYVCHSVKDAEKIFYTYVGRGVGGAIFYNGKTFEGAHAYSGEIGQLHAADGRTVEEAVTTEHLKTLRPGKALETHIADTVEILAEAFRSLVWIIDPERILLETEYTAVAPDFVDRVKERFLAIARPERGEYLPDICGVQSGELAQRGAGLALIERYLQRFC